MGKGLGVKKVYKEGRIGESQCSRYGGMSHYFSSSSQRHLRPEPSITVDLEDLRYLVCLVAVIVMPNKETANLSFLIASSTALKASLEL